MHYKPPAPIDFGASGIPPLGIPIPRWKIGQSRAYWPAKSSGKGPECWAGRGLSLDITLYFPQLSELVDFANAIPDLTIVLNHIGGLYRVGPYGNRDDEVIPAWRGGIAAVAKCPNIVLKLGGVGQPRYGFDWYTWDKPIGSEELAGHLSPLMDYCIEQFGPDRCMFESNFPPDKVSYSYNVLFSAFRPVVWCGVSDLFSGVNAMTGILE